MSAKRNIVDEQSGEFVAGLQEAAWPFCFGQFPFCEEKANGVLRGRGRKKHKVEFRRMIAYAMRQAGYGFAEIGDLMCRDHSTAIYLVSVFEDLLDVGDKKSKAFYSAVHQAIKTELDRQRRLAMERHLQTQLCEKNEQLHKRKNLPGRIAKTLQNAPHEVCDEFIEAFEGLLQDFRDACREHRLKHDLPPYYTESEPRKIIRQQKDPVAAETAAQFAEIGL